MKLLSPVTDHACFRYLERVCGLDPKPFRTALARQGKPFHEPAAAAAMAASLGMSLHDIRDLILPPWEWASAACGARQIRREGIVLLIEKHKVVTVLDKKTGGRPKIFSDAEARRNRSRMQRRARA